MKHKPIRELMLRGDQMSNVCFNWSQSERFTADERKMLKDMQRQWDQARVVVHSEMKTRSERKQR